MIPPFKGPQWTYAALGLVLLLAAGANLIGMNYVADRQNQTSTETQQQIASSLTQSLLSSLASNVSAEAYWQAGYEAVSVKWDQGWIDWEYGGYLRSLDVPVGLLFSGNGELKHLYKDESVASVTDEDLSSNPVQELVAKVLSRPPQTPPAVSQGFLTIGGTLFYGAATYVTPEHGSITPDKNRQFVLVLLRQMAPSRYTAIAHYTHTQGFEITGPAIRVKDKVGVPLLSVGGKPVALLWWSPYRPGTTLVATLGPIAVAIFVALGGVLFLILRQWKLSTAEALAAGALALAAQRESQAKSEFLGTISHELRTPLNAIIGFSDFIKGELLGPIGISKYREYAHHIHSSGLHLLRMVDHLLELVRLERKSAGLSCDTHDVVETLDEVLAMFAVEADGKAISLTRTPGIAVANAYFDRQALSRVLIHVVGNALKFTSPGGTVAVDVVAFGEHVSVCVRDTGIGIPAEHLDKVGQPFGRVGENYHLANPQGGPGLGLAISRHLIAAMQGELTIQSEYGVGTTVSIKIPQGKSSVHEPSPATGFRRVA